MSAGSRRRSGLSWLLGPLVAMLGCRGEAGESPAAAAVVASAALMQNTAAGESTEPAAEPRGNAALTCLQRAREVLGISDGDAFLLCRGAESTAPAECYAQADDRTFLSAAELFDLCRCAQSTAPVDCYERAQRETFLPARKIIALCSPIVTLDLMPSCAPLHRGQTR